MTQNIINDVSRTSFERLSCYLDKTMYAHDLLSRDVDTGLNKHVSLLGPKRLTFFEPVSKPRRKRSRACTDDTMSIENIFLEHHCVVYLNKKTLLSLPNNTYWLN